MRGELFTQLIVWLAALMAVAPAYARAAQTPTAAAVTAGTTECAPGDENCQKLANDVSQAANKVDIRDCFQFATAEPSPEIDALFRRAEGAIAAVDQPMMAAPGYDFERARRENVDAAERVLRETRDRLEHELASAADDCAARGRLEAALGRYYSGPVRSFLTAYAKHKRPARGGFGGLDIYVRGKDPRAAAVLHRMSGEWMGILDPSGFNSTQPVLRLSPIAEHNAEMAALLNVGNPTEEALLNAVGLRLANAQIANYMALDALSDNTGEIPCVPAALKRRYHSLADPTRNAAHDRWLRTETAYRQQLGPELQAALAQTPDFVTPEVIDKVKPLVPYWSQYPSDMIAREVSKFERQLSPGLLNELISSSGAPLSALSPEARRERLAALAAEAKATVTLRYIDMVFQQWKADNPQDARVARMNAIMDDLKDYAASQHAQLSGLKPVSEPDYQADADKYAKSLIPIALAAAGIQDQKEMAEGSLPLGSNTPVPPSLALPLLGKELTDDFPIMEALANSASKKRDKSHDYEADRAEALVLVATGNKPFAETRQAVDALIAGTSADATKRTVMPLVNRLMVLRDVRREVDRDGHELLSDLREAVEKGGPADQLNKRIDGVVKAAEDRLGDELGNTPTVIREAVPALIQALGPRSARAILDRIIQPKSAEDVQTQVETYLGRLPYDDTRMQLRKISHRVGLDGQTMASLDRVLSDPEMRGKVFDQQFNMTTGVLPIVDEKLNLTRYGAFGADWLAGDREASLYQLLQESELDLQNLYKLQNGHLTIDRDAVAKLVPEDRVNATVAAMQAALAPIKTPAQARALYDAVTRRSNAYHNLDAERTAEIQRRERQNNLSYHGNYGPAIAGTSFHWGDVLQAAKSGDVDAVNHALNDYWHETMSTWGYQPESRMASAMEQIVRGVMDPRKPITSEDLPRLNQQIDNALLPTYPHPNFGKEQLDRSLGWIDNLAEKGEVPGLFSGTPISPQVRSALRDFARERRASLDKGPDNADSKQAQDLLNRVKTLLAHPENLQRLVDNGQAANLQEALLSQLPMADLSETASRLRTQVDAARISPELQDAKDELDASTKALDQLPVGGVHDDVRGVLQRALVDSSIDAAKKNICENLQHIADYDNLDDMRKLMLAGAVVKSIVTEHPEFMEVAGLSQKELQDANGTFGLVFGLGMAPVFLLLMVPGVNLFVAGYITMAGVHLLMLAAMTTFAVMSTRNIMNLEEQRDFVTSLGTATYDRQRIVPNAVRDELDYNLWGFGYGRQDVTANPLTWFPHIGAYWGLAMDVSFVGLESFNTVRYARLYRAGRYSGALREVESVMNPGLLERAGLVGKKLDDLTPDELGAVYKVWATENYPSQFERMAANNNLPGGAGRFARVTIAFQTLQSAGAGGPVAIAQNLLQEMVSEFDPSKAKQPLATLTPKDWDELYRKFSLRYHPDRQGRGISAARRTELEARYADAIQRNTDVGKTALDIALEEHFKAISEAMSVPEKFGGWSRFWSLDHTDLVVHPLVPDPKVLQWYRRLRTGEPPMPDPGPPKLLPPPPWLPPEGGS